MSVALYMDEQVHSIITSGLRRRSIDVLTAQEDGHDAVPDEVVLDRATALDRVLYTQDKDFLVEAALRQSMGIDFPGVIHSLQRGVSLGRIIADLEYIALVAEPGDLANIVTRVPFP